MKKLNEKSVWIGNPNNGYCLHVGGMIRARCGITSWNNEFIHHEIQCYDIMLYLGYYDCFNTQDLLLLHPKRGLIHLLADENEHSIVVL